MDEDITIINLETRSEKIKKFFIKNKNQFFLTLGIIIILIIGYFSFEEIKKNNKIKISNQYNFIINGYNKNNNKETTQSLVAIVNKADSTYSPLSLYFIIDNNLIKEKKKINQLFDTLINKTSLDKEIKNLIIYKKGLYNADRSDENNLLNILNPIIKSNSVWKSHALYLMAEFFYAKEEKQKAKEFFNKIIDLKLANQDIKQEAQKRLNRDLSE